MITTAPQVHPNILKLAADLSAVVANGALPFTLRCAIEEWFNAHSPEDSPQLEGIWTDDAVLVCEKLPQLIANDRDDDLRIEPDEENVWHILFRLLNNAQGLTARTVKPL